VLLTLLSVGCGLRTGIGDSLPSGSLETDADSVDGEAGIDTPDGAGDEAPACPPYLILCPGDCVGTYVCVFGACPSTAPCGIPPMH
jgi:hypothetical protein